MIEKFIELIKDEIWGCKEKIKMFQNVPVIKKGLSSSKDDFEQLLEYLKAQKKAEDNKESEYVEISIPKKSGLLADSLKK